jgi:phosphoglycolate phosphatase-like HAD superfamily hydrolase
MTAASPLDLPALVVLDLDGTLARLDVDWEDVRWRVAEALVRRGLPAVAGLNATLAALEAAGHREATRTCRAILAEAEGRAARGAPLNGALLRWLQDSLPRARLAVLTMNDRRAALAALEPLVRARRLDPEDVLGREQAPSKPDPGGLLALLGRHALGPESALLIGDREVDHACGRACGVATIDVAAIGVEWVAPQTALAHARHAEAA